MIIVHSISDFDHSNCVSRKHIQEYKGVLTFDGIYKSVYENKDLLKDREVYLFVMGNYVGLDNSFDEGKHFEERFCTWGEIEELEKMGCQVGWHGWSHHDMTDMSENQLMRELSCPFETNYFAYPYGKHDERVRRYAKASFNEAFSVTDGDDSEMQRLRRYL